MKIYPPLLLPEDMKKQYLLCFIKHYAENIESETFTSKEISEFLSGFITSNSITSVELMNAMRMGLIISVIVLGD